MAGFTSILDLVSSYEPYEVIVAYVAAPLVVFALSVAVYTCFDSLCDRHDEEETYIVRYSQNVPKVYFKFSPLIAIVNIIWALIIMIIQGAFIAQHLGVGTDLQYYLKIDIPSYETVDLISTAQTSYSLQTYVSEYSSAFLTADRDSLLTADNKFPRFSGVSLLAKMLAELQESFKKKEQKFISSASTSRHSRNNKQKRRSSATADLPKRLLS